jgi:PAS domain S-box-containing protein
MHDLAPAPILVATPTGRDSALASEILHRAGIDTLICANLDELCQAIGPAAGAVLLAEEALAGASLETLLEKLHAQEPWSDLPILLLTLDGASRRRNSPAAARLAPATVVTLLERPFHTATLVSMAEAALRARRRQWQVRDLIQQRDTAIAGLQEAQETVHRQSVLLRAVTDHSPDPIFAKDVHCRMILANPATLTLIGKPPDVILGRSELEWYPENPEVAHRISENDHRILATGQAEHIEEQFGPPGAERTFLSTKAPMRDASGEIIGLIGLARDITERKRAEQDLAEAHRFLHSTIDALSGHIAVLDEQGTILAVNEAWRRFADENQFDGHDYGIGANYLKEWEPDAEDSLESVSVADALADVLRGRRDSFHLEYPCHSPTARRWFVMHVTAFRTPGPRRVVVAHENITERKLAEEAQRLSAERQKILSEALGYLLSTDDPDRAVHELYPKVATHLGVDVYLNFMVGEQGDALYLHSFGGISVETARRIRRLEFGEAICGAVAQTKCPIVATDVQHSDEDRAQLARSLGVKCYACHPLMQGSRLLGTLSFASRTRTHFDDSELEFLRVISNYVAIAMDRARAERALRLNEAQLRAIYDGTHEYIALLTTGGILLEANRAALAFGDCKREDVVGRPFWETIWFQFTPGAPEMIRRAIQQVATGESFRREVEIVNPSGQLMIFDVLLHPIRNEIGDVVLIVPEGRDITERKRAEVDLHNAKVQAETANEAKDHFLATLSHELRTPLTPVLMCLSDRANDPAVPEDLRADLAMIRRNVQLEARLIDDLLDLTRISRGKLELHSSVVDAHEILREALEICSANDTIQRSLTITLEASAEEHHVHADPARLQQVLWNLINNAIKFTPHEGRILIHTSNPQPGRLAIQVSDTGIGIEPSKIKRLFDAFEQGERHITRRFGGLGLGLAISKALVEMHGGSIHAQSEGPGRGATFTVELDTHTSSPARNGELAASHPEAVRPLRILLVEDHLPTLRIVSRLLQRAGHHVVSASSVHEARGFLDHQKFDLLISDLGLPDGTGIDLVRGLKRPLASIAVTGYGMDADVSDCLAAGFQGHLTKPVEWHQLAAAIQHVTSSPARA